MDFGVVFPQTEIGSEPGPAKELIQASENMGFEGLVVYDHVLGANTDFYKNSGVDFFYDIDDNFHEIMVLLGYAAAITERIKLITGIVILPQRQTTLIAKQAAEVDNLSNGRLVLGIAVGWNPVEFEALGEDFHNRGKRIEEQIDLMRTLWTKKVVNYQGRWHTIRQAGMKPFPVQQPIPLWIGGDAYPVLQRAGRLGDGWFPTTDHPGNAKKKLEVIRNAALEAGRDPERHRDSRPDQPRRHAHESNRGLRHRLARNRRQQVLPRHHELRPRHRPQPPGRLPRIQGDYR